MDPPIDRQFGVFRHFRPPLNRAALSFAKVALSVCPKGLRSSERLSIERSSVPAPFGKIPLTLIRPRGGRPPLLFYVHGGGFVFKAAPYHYRLAKEYALGAQVAVALPDYRLAFDSPPLAALDDCLAALRGLVAHAGDLGLDRRLFLGGDSAGAYLCLALLDRIKREGLPTPEKLLLVYPVVGPMDTPSKRAFPDTPMWNAKCNAKMWQIYGRGLEFIETYHQNPYIFPPTYVETAEFDCLRDEGNLLAQTLREAGVACTLNETKGTMHGFDIKRNAPAVRCAVEKRIAFLAEGAEKE